MQKRLWSFAKLLTHEYREKTTPSQFFVPCKGPLGYIQMCVASEFQIDATGKNDDILGVDCERQVPQKHRNPQKCYLLSWAFINVVLLVKSQNDYDFLWQVSAFPYASFYTNRDVQCTRRQAYIIGLQSSSDVQYWQH